MFDIDSIRTDPVKAREGVWVDYRGGRLKIASIENEDAENLRLTQVVKNADVIQAGGEEAEKVANQIDTEVLAYHVLKDWEGMSQGGEPLEYTPELGVKLLGDPQMVRFRKDVERIAQSQRHYRPEAEEAAVTSVKKAAAS